MKVSLRFPFGLGLGVLLAVFALQNLEVTSVRLLFWNTTLPLVIVILGSVAIGVLLATLWLAMRRPRAGARAQDNSTTAAPGAEPDRKT